MGDQDVFRADIPVDHVAVQMVENRSDALGDIYDLTQWHLVAGIGEAVGLEIAPFQIFLHQKIAVVCLVVLQREQLGDAGMVDIALQKKIAFEIG